MSTAVGTVQAIPWWKEPTREQWLACERFPTEVRSTAAGFCYHQGAIFGGLVASVVTYFAVNHGLGFGIPLLVATTGVAASFVVALLLSPETKGKELVPDLVVA